jgi:IS5 family transposase
VTDNDDEIVADHALEQGNPADAPQLAPAVGRVISRTGRRPRTVTADRGYGEKSVDDALHEMGVRYVVIPRKGRPGKARQSAEHRPAFRRTVKWRTGSEGRISSPKRGYDLPSHGPRDTACASQQRHHSCEPLARRLALRDVNRSAAVPHSAEVRSTVPGPRCRLAGCPLPTGMMLVAGLRAGQSSQGKPASQACRQTWR